MTVDGEIAILDNRFRKASKLADILDGEGVTYSEALHMQEPNWAIVIRAAGLKDASEVTRALALMVLRDREERKHRG